MPDGEARESDIVPWEFGDLGLTILPGISWDEYRTLWNTVEGLAKRSSWYLGDALCAGEANFGEDYAALTGDWSPERIKQAKWVSSRIPLARRRATLSWSLHREIAKLNADDQEELLSLAEQNGWHTRDVKDAIAARKHNAIAAPEPEQLALPAPERDSSAAPEPLERDLDPPVAPRTNGADTAPEPGPRDPARFTRKPTYSDPDELIRALITNLRANAEAFAAGTVADLLVAAFARDILSLPDVDIQVEGRYPNPLLYTDDALELVPSMWRTTVRGEALLVPHHNRWSVELRRGDDKVSISVGPHLPSAIVEAALGAILSDRSDE